MRESKMIVGKTQPIRKLRASIIFVHPSRRNRWRHPTAGAELAA